MQTQFDAIIIGGGVTGNACALGLAQIGVNVAHVSLDAPVSMRDGLDARIYALSNANVGLLQRLRVWDALDATRICPVSTMHIFGDTDSESKSSSRGKLNFSAYNAHISELAWIVEQNNVQQALHSALRFTSNVTTFHATASHLKLLSNGIEVTTNSKHTLNAKLLIGADGASSWVRQAHGIDLNEFDYHQKGVVANFSCEQPHNNCAYQWFFDNGDVLALLPLPNQHVSMVYSCALDIANEVMLLTPEMLEERICELSENVLGKLTTVTQAQSFPLKKRRAKQFIAPNTLLMGDAAHTVHPLSGHGLNLGLQDLDCLLGVLHNRESHRAINDNVLLRRYERARIAPTLEMQHVTHTLNRLFQHSNPIVQQARNVGMNVLNTLPSIKRKLIQVAMGEANRPEKKP